MSYFDPSNCEQGTLVYEVETKRRLDNVLAVDTTAGLVVRAEKPFRVVGGEVATCTERYSTIHAIYASGLRPTLFHCYGRKAP